MTPQEHIAALDERIDAIEDRENERRNAFRRARAFVRKVRSRAISAGFVGDAVELLTVAVEVLARGEE